ncbi:Helix-destabilizing protein [Candidatus Rubidus massiliensis]|nr:MAG: single-stranded DNA-binding protein [Chlamydia sp. 32-24]CDZ80403.1 Helix-destabilizing protein [Candidatus Rubidus massiliensis]
MAALNKVLIAGRLTRKPELRKTPKGNCVTDLLIALNREFTTLEGEKQQEVCFVDVVVWGKQAEVCVQVLDCSSLVLVEGRLQLDVWYAKDGEKRCKLRVHAEKVQFLDRKNYQSDKVPEMMNTAS